MYRHASATWDELSPEERERAIGFQTDTTSHTKVTKLEHNAILGRGMDLNSLTWLLVTCVLFQMYTTPTLIQSACNFGDATSWHLLIFNILHFTFSVGGGGEVPCNLTQVVYDTPKGTLVSKETIQPSTNLHSWIVENLIHQVFQTHFSIPFHVFPTTLSLWKTNSPRRKKTMSQTCELNMKMCLHFQWKT